MCNYRCGKICTGECLLTKEKVGVFRKSGKVFIDISSRRSIVIFFLSFKQEWRPRIGSHRHWEAFISRGQSIPTCQRMQCTRRSKEEAFPVWVWPDTTYIIIIHTMLIRGYYNYFNRFLSLKWIRNCIRHFEINQKWLRQLSSIFISLANWYRRFFLLRWNTLMRRGT